MENIEKYKELFEDARKQMFGVINFGQTVIETYREKADRNFLIRFPMLFFHESLQSGRGFLLLTKQDSINYPSGAAVLLRNGFESIVWGTSCLDDKDGTELIDYIWNHQDIILEKDMAIYKKWKLSYSDGRVSILKAAKQRLDKIVSSSNKFQHQGMPLRKSYSIKHIKNVFKELVNKNGVFKYYFETCYNLVTNAWHSSAFGMRLTQYEEVKHYFLGNIANLFTECLKVFSNEAIRKFSGKEDLFSLLYRGVSESLRKQMERIEKGEDIEISPSVNLVLKFKETDENK